MNAKIKIAFITALATGLIAAFLVELQLQANQCLRSNLAAVNKNLTALRTSHEKEPEKYSTPVPEPDAAPAQGTPRTATATDFPLEPGAAKIRLKTQTLDKIGFQVLTGRLEPTETARLLLQISPAEMSQLQTVLGQLKERAVAHDVSSIRAIAPTDLPDDDFRSIFDNFIRSRQGKLALFSIEGYAESERAALLAWFDEQINAVLGRDRSAVFLARSQTNLGVLISSGNRTIAFDDYVDPTGKPLTNWVFNTDGTIHQGVGFPDAIPESFKYLFESREGRSIANAVSFRRGDSIGSLG